LLFSTSNPFSLKLPLKLVDTKTQYQSLYTAFDVFPSAKGAGTHIPSAFEQLKHKFLASLPKNPKKVSKNTTFFTKLFILQANFNFWFH
jgi:hypothetical protein